jgi:hypothetical protein
MPMATDVTRPPLTPEKPAGRLDGEVRPHSVPVMERVRKLPEALLLTTGYYASRVRALRELLDRLD